MLLTTQNSQAKKTAGIAVTYRAAPGNPYGVCPSTCPLAPSGAHSTDTIDKPYLRTLLGAVPRGGHAFTYTHFHPKHWSCEWNRHQITSRPTTVVNFSADSPAQLAVIKDTYPVPTTLAVPLSLAARWGGSQWRVAYHGTRRVVRCPAEWNSRVTCQSCGGGIPLCARPHRDYTIGFTAHGSQAKLVGSGSPGGCYASNGPAALQWHRLARKGQPEADSAALRAFVGTLPPFAILRHHVAGDLGRPQE